MMDKRDIHGGLPGVSPGGDGGREPSMRGVTGGATPGGKQSVASRHTAGVRSFAAAAAVAGRKRGAGHA
jgi:hypothetical protein